MIVIHHRFKVQGDGGGVERRGNKHLIEREDVKLKLSHEVKSMVINDEEEDSQSYRTKKHSDAHTN